MSNCLPRTILVLVSRSGHAYLSPRISLVLDSGRVMHIFLKERLILTQTSRTVTIPSVLARVREHRHANSAVYDHLDGCQVCDDKLFIRVCKILDSGRSDVESANQEALYINFHKPMFNRQLYNQSSSFISDIF